MAQLWFIIQKRVCSSLSPSVHDSASSVPVIHSLALERDTSLPAILIYRRVSFLTAHACEGKLDLWLHWGLSPEKYFSSHVQIYAPAPARHDHAPTVNFL